MSAPKGNTHGLTSNPQNRNKTGIRGKRGPRSKLKSLAAELLERVPKAMSIIDAVLDAKKDEDGEPIVKDKDQLQLARWICERAVATQTAAIAEEKAKHNIKKELADDEEEEKEEVVPEVPKQRFSLTMIDGNKEK